METKQPQAADTTLPVSQQVRWGPSDAKPAGISVWSDTQPSAFIPWIDLKPELDLRLIPQLFADPQGYTFETREYNGKQDWLVRIVKDEEIYCGAWFGDNPDNGWAFDGLIHVGDPVDPHTVWQTYQRFSDGSYRRLHSSVASIDEFIRRSRNRMGE